jgi:hypothetical protein
MSNERLLTSREEEPIKESEISCDFCGPSVQASWDVVTNEDEVVFVCHRHHTRLLEKNLVFVERRIGEETWEEIEDYRILLNKIDMEKNE